MEGQAGLLRIESETDRLNAQAFDTLGIGEQAELLRLLRFMPDESPRG